MLADSDLEVNRVYLRAAIHTRKSVRVKWPVVLSRVLTHLALSFPEAGDFFFLFICAYNVWVICCRSFIVYHVGPPAFAHPEIGLLI
jgi:hypothetical protein